MKIELALSPLFDGWYSRAVVIVAMSFLGVLFASGQDLSRPADPIQIYLQPLIDDHTLAGAVVLIADKNGTVDLQAVGYRDLASRAPMPENALFWIASTSKTMTVSAVMMLVDQGRVQLDDPVEMYLPEFKNMKVGARHPDKDPATIPVPASHAITVREILSHTSGLRFRSKAQPGALDLLSLKDQIASYAAEPLIFQPGTDYEYSNEGINTAARIIEVVSGMPYEQFIQQRLFDPLGMHDTTFWPTTEQIARLATSYKVDKETKDLAPLQIVQLTYPLNSMGHRYPMPAGGIFSTAADVSLFCRMLLNNGVFNRRQILSRNAIHEMTTEQNHGFGGHSYGLGMAVEKSSFGHGGAYKNDMNIDPSSGRILVFMAQQDGPWGTPAGDAMVPTLEQIADKMVTALSKQ